MKIKELLKEVSPSPEMTEENLLKIIDSNLPLLRDLHLLRKVRDYNKDKAINEAVLAEFDKIQDKKSYLSSSQRKLIEGFVGFCMIRMTKGDGTRADVESSSKD